MSRFSIIALAACAAFAASPAHAQYRIKSLDFDIWCGEVEHLPAERCAQRLTDDVQKFEAFRDIIDRYEIEHQKAQDHLLHFDRYILRNDPVERTKAPVPDRPPPTDGKDQ